MRLSEIRDEIAEILSSLEGIEGYTYRPSVSSEGEGWALLESLSDPFGENFRATWRVIVRLPVGEVEAMEWFQDNVEPITEAFFDAGFYVEEVVPGSVQTEAGSFDAMILTIYREA